MNPDYTAFYMEWPSCNEYIHDADKIITEDEKVSDLNESLTTFPRHKLIRSGRDNWSSRNAENFMPSYITSVW